MLIMIVTMTTMNEFCLIAGGEFVTAGEKLVWHRPSGILPPAAAVPLSQLLIFLAVWTAGVVIYILFYKVDCPLPWYV